MGTDLCMAGMLEAQERYPETLREVNRLRDIIKEIRREATVLADLERPGMTRGIIADLCDKALGRITVAAVAQCPTCRTKLDGLGRPVYEARTTEEA